LPLSAVDAINPAFQHTAQQLLKPFRAGEWAKLALVGFLAGEMGPSGCSVPNLRGLANGGSHHFVQSGLPNLNIPRGPHLDPVALAALVAFLMLAGVAFGVVLIYLNSMMRFVLFDCVIAKQCRIGEAWRRRHAAGLRYFVWQILLLLTMTASMVILIGIPAGLAFVLGWPKQPNQHLVGLILGGTVVFFVFMALALGGLIVTVLTKDFVVPQMALESISAIEGWRRLLTMMKSEKASYAGYLGMKIVLALGAAVVVGIAAAIVALVLLIPVGGIGVIAVLAGMTAGLTWNLYTITLAIVAGCMMLAILFYVMALVSVPPMVFFPAYSIYFFAARYRQLGAMVYPLPANPAQTGPSLPASPEPAG
jgi:hypothetical protein